MKDIVLVPSYRYVEPETMTALARLPIEVRIKRGHSAIDLARSIMATDALLEGYENIYWIDSDIHFELSDWESLATMGPFACCPYTAKELGGKECIVEYEGEIIACGFGFVKTNRVVLEKIAQSLPTCRLYDRPLIPFFKPDVWTIGGNNYYYAEDYSFCLRARESGFKLECNFDSDIGHIGRFVYRR